MAENAGAENARAELHGQRLFGPRLHEPAMRGGDSFPLVAKPMSNQLESIEHESEFSFVSDEAIDAVDENLRLRQENEQLHQQIRTLELEIERVSEENRDLATKVVYQNEGSGHPNQSPSPQATGDTANLSWEERKAQIIEQLENDTFNADDFLATLDIKPLEQAEQDSLQVAIDYLNELDSELLRLRKVEQDFGLNNQHYEDEITQLKQTLDELQKTVADGLDENRSDPQTRADEILDQDELIRQERERLRQRQEECDAMTRQLEVSSSLERAKLSRTVTELEQQNRDLQRRIEAFENQQQEKERTGMGTRWMAKLGLTSDKD